MCALVLKVVNAAAEPMDAAVELRGASRLGPTATVSVLTSASPDDENSFEAPAKIAPRQGTIRNVAPIFRHTFPANSVTVLRLQTL